MFFKPLQNTQAKMYKPLVLLDREMSRKDERLGGEMLWSRDTDWTGGVLTLDEATTVEKHDVIVDETDEVSNKSS